MNDSSNNFIICKKTNAEVAENETVGPHFGGHVNKFARPTVGENCASHD